VLASPTSSACSEAKVRNPLIAATEVKNPIETGMPGRKISVPCPSGPGSRFVSAIGTTTSAASAHSTVAPYHAASKPQVSSRNSPSGGPSAMPR
jgi:hypothetical protein